MAQAYMESHPMAQASLDYPKVVTELGYVVRAEGMVREYMPIAQMAQVSMQQEVSLQGTLRGTLK
jgi:hypothetical protein